MRTHRPPARSAPARPLTRRTVIVIVIVVLVLGAALTRGGLPVVVVAEALTTCGLIGAHLARRTSSGPGPASAPAPAPAPEGL